MQRQQVKSIAVGMAEADGLINLSREALCKKAGIPDGSFLRTMGCSFIDFVEELRSEGVTSPFRPVSKRRTSPALRKEHILECAVALAKEKGYDKVTRVQIANAAGVTGGLVGKYFATMTQLRKAIMRQAVLHEIPEIIAQGLANGDDRAKRAPAELKHKAAMMLVDL